MARRKQTKTDQIVAKLTPEQLDYLHNDLCRQHANATEIHRWLLGFDPTLSYDSVLTWYSREYPQGAIAQEVNALIAECRGINPIDAHAAALAAVIKLTDLITDHVVQGGLEEMTPSLLSNYVDLLREQRQSAQQLYNMKRLEDRRSLILAGGYAVATNAHNLARDTGSAEAVKSVIDASLAKLEEEA